MQGHTQKIPLGSRFFLLAELRYSPKGNPLFDGSHLSLQCLSLPHLVGYKLVGNLALVAGPTCCYLIQAKFKPDIIHIDPTFYYRPIDYGFDVGLRFQFTHHMGEDFRWDRGLVGIYKNDQSLYLSNGNAIWTYLGLTKVPNKDNPRNQNVQLGIFSSVK